MTAKSAEAFRTISEVAEEIGVPQHVLRFWETKFSAVRPMKRGGNRRYYRPDDVALLKAINERLYTDGYTIKGVQKLLKEKGPKGLVAGRETVPAAPASAPPPTLFDERAPVAASPVGAASPQLMASLQSIRDSLATALKEAQA